MARRERGTGSVYADPKRPGRYIGEVTIGGRRRRVSGTSKTDVRAKLKMLTSKRDTGQAIGNRKITVRDIVTTFMEREVPNRTSNGRPLAPATVETYQWAAGILIAELGTMRMADLAVRDVEAMLDRLARRKTSPLSKASLTKLLSRFTLMITFAEKRGDVTRNVATFATIPPKAQPRRERSALAPDDARKLLEALRTERNGAMFALGLRLGLRPGEAAALWWDDLALDSTPPTVNVTRGIQRTRSRAAISDDLKTSAAKRTLAAPPDLAAWLAEQRHAQRLERVAAERWDDPHLVFATPTGRIIDPKVMRADLKDICQRAGVPAVLPNELRHSCASLLADEGVPNEAIADLLGHTTTRMVDQTYRHRLRPVVDVATRATWAEAR